MTREEIARIIDVALSLASDRAAGGRMLTSVAQAEKAFRDLTDLRSYLLAGPTPVIPAEKPPPKPIQTRDFIEQIRAHRVRFGSTLLEAKNAVLDGWRDDMPGAKA